MSLVVEIRILQEREGGIPVLEARYDRNDLGKSNTIDGMSRIWWSASVRPSPKTDADIYCNALPRLQASTEIFSGSSFLIIPNQGRIAPVSRLRLNSMGGIFAYNALHNSAHTAILEETLTHPAGT